MKNFLRYFVAWSTLCLLFILTFCLMAFAEVTDPLTIPDFFTQIWQLIGQAKGAGGLGIALLLTQLAMQFFRTDLANFAGKWKLTLVLLFSLVAGMIAQKITGADWTAAIFNSATLAALQVFAHQLIKQFTEKEV